MHSDIRSIARALGGEVSGRNTISIPTPGHSANDRGTVITFDPSAPGGVLVHSFNGGDPLQIKDMVRRARGLPAWEPGDNQDRRIPANRIREWDRAMIDGEAEDRHRNEDDLIRIRRARELWDAAGDPRRTLAEIYLREHRKLDLGDDLAGTVLRFHPHCPWRDENTGRTIYVPAMIAAFRSIDDDTITAVHRIAMRPDGSKIDRRMLGVVQRAAVKLDSVGAELAIGEGIETCMAAKQLGLPVPVWALGSVGSISWFPLIDGVSHLRILTEIGRPSTEATKICGRRWIKAKRKVTRVAPEHGSDMNDELIWRLGQ